MNPSRTLVYGEPVGRLVPIWQALLRQLDGPFEVAFHDLCAEPLDELSWSDSLPGIRALQRAEAEILLEDANRAHPRELSRDPRLRRLEAIVRISSELIGVLEDPLALRSHPLIARLPTSVELV